MEGVFILADSCDHLVIRAFDQVPMLDDFSLVSSSNMGAISILVEWLFGFLCHLRQAKLDTFILFRPLV